MDAGASSNAGVIQTDRGGQFLIGHAAFRDRGPGACDLCDQFNPPFIARL
jgi:hypothetical protein